MPFSPPDCDPGLRAELDEITSSLVGAAAERQVGAVAALAGRHPHGIRLLQEVPATLEGPARYNCFMFALGLAPPPVAVHVVMHQAPDTYPGADFVRWLVTTSRLTPAAGPLDGAVVVYFDGEGPRHAGLLDGDDVVSKWGLGHLWRHGCWEVPRAYGDTVRLFDAPGPGAGAAWFLEFAARLARGG